MSIAFMPVNAQSNLFNESSVNEKWNLFISSITDSLSSTYDVKIDKTKIKSILEKNLTQHYSNSTITSSVVNDTKVVNEGKVRDEDKVKKEDKVKTGSKVKKEKERCSQILKNNEQCKANAINDSLFCSRHTKKEN